MIGIIYEHRNKINGKRYVGQTIQTLEARKKEGYFNTKFANALNKYGWDNFETGVLWELESDNKNDLMASLNIIEETIIMSENLQDDNFGYNVKAGGFNGSFKHTPEAIEKIRQASLNRTSGRFVKGSQAWRLRAQVPPSEEHKQKVSDGLKKAYASGDRKPWNKDKKLTNAHIAAIKAGWQRKRLLQCVS